MKINEYNVEFKKLQNQVDEKITNLENEADGAAEAIEKMAMTYEELDNLIEERNSAYVVKNKVVSVSPSFQIGSPAIAITDDDIKSGTFVRVLPADKETQNNLYNYFDGGNEFNPRVIGNQLLIFLDSSKVVNAGSIIPGLTFNLIYRIYKKEGSGVVSFIHTELYIGEVINNG